MPVVCFRKARAQKQEQHLLCAISRPGKELENGRHAKRLRTCFAVVESVSRSNSRARMSQEALVGGLVIGSAALVVSSHVALDCLLVTVFAQGG